MVSVQKKLRKNRYHHNCVSFFFCKYSYLCIIGLKPRMHVGCSIGKLVNYVFQIWYEGRKFIFNNALNKFYLYGVRHMVMDHSNS